MMSMKCFTSTPVKDRSKDFTINMSEIKERENVDVPTRNPLTFTTKDYRFKKIKKPSQTKWTDPPLAPTPTPTPIIAPTPAPAMDEMKAKNVSVNSLIKESLKEKDVDEKNLTIILEEAINEPEQVGKSAKPKTRKPEEIEKENSKQANLDQIELEGGRGTCLNNTTIEPVIKLEKSKIKHVIKTNKSEKLSNSNTKQPFIERNIKENKSRNKIVKKSAIEKKKPKRIPEVKIVVKKNAAGKLMKYPSGASYSNMTPSSYTQVHFIHKGFVYVTIDCQNPTIYKEGEFLTIPEGSCYLIKNESPLECQIATLN